jgi:hypothetical protein
VGARFDASGLRGDMAAGARSVTALAQRVWSWDSGERDEQRTVGSTGRGR